MIFLFSFYFIFPSFLAPKNPLSTYSEYVSLDKDDEKTQFNAIQFSNPTIHKPKITKRKIPLKRKKNQLVNLFDIFEFKGNVGLVQKNDHIINPSPPISVEQVDLESKAFYIISWFDHLFHSFAGGGNNEILISNLRSIDGQCLAHEFQIMDYTFEKSTSFSSQKFKPQKIYDSFFIADETQIFYAITDLSEGLTIFWTLREDLKKIKVIRNNNLPEMRAIKVVLAFNKYLLKSPGIIAVLEQGGFRLGYFSNTTFYFSYFEALLSEVKTFSLISNDDDPEFFMIYLTTDLKIVVQAYSKLVYPYTLREQFSYIAFIQSLPDTQTISNIFCEFIKKEKKTGIECLFFIDSHKILHFTSFFKKIDGITTLLPIQSKDLHQYHSFGITEHQRCEFSDNYISCELNFLNQNHGYRISTFIASWPRIDGKYKGNGYTTRIEPKRNKELCSKLNFRVTKSSTDSIVYPDFKGRVFKLMNLEPRVNIQIDLKHNRFRDVINAKKITITTNPRTQTRFEIGGPTQFEIDVDETLLKISFIFCGCIIFILILFFILISVKKCLKKDFGYDDYQYVEDNLSKTDAEQLQGELEDSEFGGGIRFQVDSTFQIEDSAFDLTLKDD